MVIFDAYELRARFAPALVVASPWVLVAIAFVWKLGSTFLSTSGAALVFLGLLYAFSFVVRALGRQIENGLWKSWGGPPSGTILGEADPTFSAETKSQIRACLESTLRVKGANEPDWANDVGRVQEAFRLVRQHIRQRDPNGLWSVHNAEYGFLRNLLGAWWLLLVNSLLATGVAVVSWHVYGDKSFLFLAVPTLVLCLGAVAARLSLPGVIRTAAFRYAESAWASFVTNAQGTKPANHGGSGA